MFKKIAQLFGGDPFKRKVDSLRDIVDQINAQEATYKALSDAALKAKTAEFRARLVNGETLDDLLVDAFAAVREASKRTLGQWHYDVQLITGITLHRGEIAEMKTGEGKTLAATLPLYLNALAGKGVHLVTVNDYLARRDGRWMGRIYHMLGMQVGILQMASRTEHGKKAFLFDPDKRSNIEEEDQLRMVDRADAYQADITYGTNNEFGFDYLRDNLTRRKRDKVQRGHYYAIIDEVDNILIDEARTPLIISGPSHEDAALYEKMALIVNQLEEEDYEINEKDRVVSLTEIGIVHVEDLLDMPLRDPERPEDITPDQAKILGFLEQALRAEYLFHRDKDYIVQGNEVIIVDEFTGRLMPGRRWSDGLHQAVEAKEKRTNARIRIQPENITHATITIQNYFRMYEKLAGMTGTALTESEEFYRIYGLEVLPIPTNLEYRSMGENPELIRDEAKDDEGYTYAYYYEAGDSSQAPQFWVRQDYPDVVFKTEEAKLRAIVREIIYYHVVGRPQLVGTTSVEKSDYLSNRLNATNVRRLVEVLLIREAYIRQHDIAENDFRAMTDLEALHQPLDQLRSPELRRMGREYGLTSLSPLDEDNRAVLLSLFNLSDAQWSRFESVIKAGIPHQVLNARKHTEESLIIAGAGAFGAVTIATNMAGRGVDIKLGGELAENVLANLNHLLSTAGVEDPYDLDMDERLQALKALPEETLEQCDCKEDIDTFYRYMEEMRIVRQLGGLHVIGSERHDARRIDNQLRGRAARQGDPGSSRFFLSFEDDLMRLFGGAQAEALLTRFNLDEDMPIEIGLVGRLIESSQSRVEGANFDVRKHLLEYDDVLNTQRERIYEQRDRIFDKEDLREDVTDMLRMEVSRRVELGMQDEEGPWKLLAYLEDVQQPLRGSYYHPSFSLKIIMEMLGKYESPEQLKKALLILAENALKAMHAHYKRRVKLEIQREKMRYENYRAERLDALDAFIDGLGYEQEGSPRDLKKEIRSLVLSSLRVSDQDLVALASGSSQVEDDLRQQISATAKQLSTRRLIHTFERNLNEHWPLKASDLMRLSWEEIEAKLMEKIEDSLKRSADMILGESGQIAKDLEKNSSELQEALQDPSALMELLIMMMFGRVITFDEISHRRKIKAKARLNYIFLAAQQLEGRPVEEVQKEVLDHLEKAQDKLNLVYGQARLDDLQAKSLTFGDLEKEGHPIVPKLVDAYGEELFQELKIKNVDQLSEENRQKAVEIFGHRIQNNYYRQVLLSHISSLWVDYLTKVEALRISVKMEAYAQRDPLVQYKGQASEMFSQLLSDIRAAVIHQMFRARLLRTQGPKPVQKVIKVKTKDKKKKKSSRKRHRH